MQHFFRLSEGGERQLADFSERMRRLIFSAVDFNALLQPNRELVYKVYMGEKWQYPRLTDTSTLSGVLTEDQGLSPIAQFTAFSTVNPKSVFSPHYFAGDEQLIDRNVRYLLLTPDDATDRDVEMNQPVDSRKVKLYRTLESSVPGAFDYVRDFKRQVRIQLGNKDIEPMIPESVERINATGRVHHPWMEVRPGKADATARKAVIIAMHWLQAGGAERWALETVKLVEQAGLLPIVLTDRDGHQPWIIRSEFDNAVLLPMTMPLQENVGDPVILRALFEQFNVIGVLVHHCQWMYDRLWWVKRYFPQTRVVDSLHIVEYFFRGGYPKESVARDEWIDLHHVISPQLVHWLVDIHHIDAEKVVDAPLVGLTAESSHGIAFKTRNMSRPFTVSFVGRMVRQKRPEAFILTAKALEKAKPGAFRFIMHGNGDMDAFVDELIKRYRLQNVIERRGMEIPVQQTYAESDALLISSINEGITLTTIEALSQGIPVVSADVGSQRTLIPAQGLCRRVTNGLVHDARRILLHMLDDEAGREHLWKVEEQRLEEFSKLESAESYFKKMLEKWGE